MGKILFYGIVHLHTLENNHFGTNEFISAQYFPGHFVDLQISFSRGFLRFKNLS